MSISLVFVASQLLLEIEVIQRREAVCRKNEDIWKPINLLLKELGNIWRDTGCIAILVRYIASRPVLFKNVTKFDLHWGKINGDPSESNVLWGSIKRAAEPSFRSILLSIDSYCSASTSWRSRSDLSFVMQLYWSAWSCFMTISLSSDKDRPKFFFSSFSSFSIDVFETPNWHIWMIDTELLETESYLRPKKSNLADMAQTSFPIQKNMTFQVMNTSASGAIDHWDVTQQNLSHATLWRGIME